MSQDVFALESLEARRLLAGAVIDLHAVMPAALDLPRINLAIQRGDGMPLSAKGSFNVRAIYDTAASGILLSSATADALGITRLTVGGAPVVFSDIGALGSDSYYVSELLSLYLAPDGADADLDNPATWRQVYDQVYSDIRAQLAIGASVGIDVVGTPAMEGKVVVIEPAAMNDFVGMIATAVVDAAASPQAEYHVKLSFADFGRFTHIDAAGADGPARSSNPFIGPDPVAAMRPDAPADDTPGVTVRRGGREAAGSWLLDTGAAASILSLEMARSLGVYYATDTYGTDAPRLVDAAGKTLPGQFEMTVVGAAGMRKVAGFYLDELLLPTVEGEALRFRSAPVLVSDITVRDPATGETLTLDGVLGMNYLAASGSLVEAGGQYQYTQLKQGPFDQVVFDEAGGLLGLTVAQFPAAEAAAANVNASGSTPVAFTVAYSGVDPATLGAGDILVTASNGFSVQPSLEGVVQSGDRLLATYSFAPPGGSWDYADSGAYTLSMRAAAVGDGAQHWVDAGAIASFDVRLRDGASPLAAAQAAAAPRKGKTFVFRVSYRDENAMDADTLGAGDVLVKGPRYKQLATLVKTTLARGGRELVATYRITAPGGAWDARDKGNYVIQLRPKQVMDASGNPAAGRTLASFTFGSRTKNASKLKIYPATKAMRAPAPASRLFSLVPIHQADALLA